MISVIIPIYNNEDELHVCLNSVLKQTYEDIEIICIDDASTDSSIEILEYFSQKDSKIKILKNDSKSGWAYCKNKGLEIAQGEYILFLDSTDWITSNTLEVLYTFAKSNNLDLIFLNNEQSDITNYLSLKCFNPNELNRKIIMDLNKISTIFFSADFINKNGIKLLNDNTNFYENIMLAEKISLIDNKFIFTENMGFDNQNLDEMIHEENLKNIKIKISNLNQNVNSIKKLNKKQNEGQINISNSLDELIKSQNEINKNLNQTINLVNDNYNELKRYFYNDCEDSLKKYLNTDELFKLCYFNNFKFLSYSPAENRILIKTDDDIILGTNNRFYTIKEVIGFNGYSIPQLYDFDEFVVFDIGLNRAYASLWFAKFDNCKSIYGFEIDPETYEKALSNINLNPKLSNKISAFNFGLSNEDKEVDLYYVKGCDGVNTMFTEVVNCQAELKDKSKLKTKKVEVKKASTVISDIIKNHNIDSNIVLKVDTEGAEYDIISDLIETNLISKIDVILGEGHIFEREHYCDKLKELGFKQIKLDINPVSYNFAFIKQEHFNIWPLKE